MLAIKTKNILFVSQYLYPHGGGGSGRFVYDNARHLAQAGYQVDILLPRAASDLKYQIDDDHINIHSFGSRLYFILKKFIPRTILDLIWSRHYVKKLLKKQKYYLVVFHHLPAAAFCFNLKNLRGQKWLYQFYASPFMEWKFEHEAAYTPAKKVFGFFLLWLEKRLYAHAPRLIVLSRYTKNILTDNFKVPVEKITELSGAVDTAQFYRRQIVPAEINSLWPANTFKLLSVRRLEKRMGLEMLIKAVALLKEQGCKISLVIAGTGMLADDLQAKIKQCRLEKEVKLSGFVPDEKLAALYGAADLFILPTIALEGFGLVTLESLACGTPVVATDVAATPEIINKLDHGFLVKPDAKNLSEAVSRLMTLPFEQRAELKIRAAEFAADNYAWDKVGKKFEETYENTANQ